jgi:hypothetical protein
VALQGRLGDAVGLRRAMLGFAAVHLAVLVVVRLTRRDVAAVLDAPAAQDAGALAS